MRAIPEPDGRLLHNYCSDPGSACGLLLGSMPATQRYNVCPEATIPHGAIGGRLGKGGQAWAREAGLGQWRPVSGLDVNLPVY